MVRRRHRSKVILLTKTGAGILLMLALFFIPAGTLDWPEAWLFILFYLATVGGVFIWLKKKSPSLLKERLARKKEAKRLEDRALQQELPGYTEYSRTVRYRLLPGVW
jgi:protein-S-isoprenylcysteine O-methyltransferase Ste14